MALIETIVASSDLMDIRSEQPETRLIYYSNKLNFSGIDYTDSPVFNLRVNSKFFKEREVEELESEGLSNEEVVALSGSVKSQKMLQVEPVPYYVQKKLKRIFKHNTINIEGVYYTQEEALEYKELNEHYGLVASEVWLTVKDGEFETNVFGEITEI